MTPSTSLIRSPKIPKSIPRVHKGLEQSNCKGFLVTRLHRLLQRSVVTNCLGNSSSSPAPPCSPPGNGARSAFPSGCMTSGPSNMLHRPKEPERNPQLCSPFVSEPAQNRLRYRRTRLAGRGEGHLPVPGRLPSILAPWSRYFFPFFPFFFFFTWPPQNSDSQVSSVRTLFL